jgi:chemotaxis protein histidine kinase CheA
MKTIEGNYPNWRQVIPKAEQHRTTVALPEEHEFAKILNGLPGGESKDKPVDLVVENGSVSVKDPAGGSSVTLAGAKAKGADVTIRVNREYLTKAFAFSLTSIGIIDAMSPLHFTCEGRQMVVMPLRVANEIATPAAETPPAPIEPQPTTNQTAPVEPQPERETTMPATNGHTNGAMPQVNGATRSTTLPETEKPSLEVAIEKLDAFKVTFRETLAGLTELTSLLKQSVRDQKAGEKEVHQVRQTLRSLQSVRI